MILCECPHCDWSDQVDADYEGQVVECPSCANDFKVTVKRKAVSQARKKMSVKSKTALKTSAGQGRSRSRSKKSGRRALRLGAAKSLLIFQIFCCLFMFGGLGVMFFTMETEYEKQAAVNPVFGGVCLVIGAILGLLFTWLLVAFNKKGSRAYRFTCGLASLYIFSPFFFWGLMALKQLTHADVLEAYGIEEDE